MHKIIFGSQMKTFANEMQERLRSIDARARAAGSNMTQVCKNTGVARATYERALQRVPQSVSKVDELEAEVTRLEKLAVKKAEALRAPVAA
jgi:hypothetical protein